MFLALALCGLSTVSATSPSPPTPPAAPPPPPPPPLCGSLCSIFLDGYTATSPVNGCYKTEGSGIVCRPGRTDQFGTFTCNTDHTICGSNSVSGFNPPPPSPPPTAACADRKPPKCAKKVAKNKCAKRSSQKKCRLSCNYCTVG